MYNNLSSKLAQSQSGVRSALRSPLVAILGVAYALLSVSLLIDLISYLFAGPALAALRPDDGSTNVLLTLLCIVIVLLYFVSPIVFSVAFFVLSANAKKNPRRPMEKTGSTLFLAAAIIQTACWFLLVAFSCLSVFFVYLDIPVKFWVGLLSAIAFSLPSVFMAIYSICFIGFAETLRRDVTTTNISSGFSVILAVLSLIAAVGTPVVMILYALDNAESIMFSNFTFVLFTIINVMMAIFCFTFKSVVKKAKHLS